jgi:hypothetical protein
LSRRPASTSDNGGFELKAEPVSKPAPPIKAVPLPQPHGKQGKARKKR